MEKILFLKANPIDTRDLRLDLEEKKIIAALERSGRAEKFIFISRGAVTKDELTTHLHLNDPNFLHISGHASEGDQLFLEDNDGFKQEVSLKNFYKLISENFEDIYCLFLNTCHSLKDFKDIDTKIPFIIGMKNKVPNSLATDFSIEFYKAIFSGRTVDSAFRIALNIIDLTNPDKDHIPLLLANTESADRKRRNPDEEEKLPSRLVSQKEIDLVKSIHIKSKKFYSRIAVGLMTTCMGLAGFLLFTEGLKISPELISTLTPAFLSSYPLIEVRKRNDRITLLKLFELKIEAFKRAIRKLSSKDIQNLNEEFQRLVII